MDDQHHGNHPHDPPNTRRLGLGMVIAMWLLLIALLAYLFSHWERQQVNPNQVLNQQSDIDDIRQIVLQRNRFGHYVTNGQINGQVVVFMLDTGASDVSIPSEIAQRLGLQQGATRYYETAKGPAIGYATRLDSIAIGDIRLRDIRASINPNTNGDEILLGMSFLKQIEFTQRGDKLTLRQYH